MGQETAITWTVRSWNPWQGCKRVSAGCKNCHMFAVKKKYRQDPDTIVRSKTTFAAPLRQ
ncbi:MAG: DUF5131 family protein [Dehalococcoidales bacterium]|nr:DUF5131 family protein [Dehalococcoidales bacterium]